jgi:hypothetical protein
LFLHSFNSQSLHSPLPVSLFLLFCVCTFSKNRLTCPIKQSVLVFVTLLDCQPLHKMIERNYTSIHALILLLDWWGSGGLRSPRVMKIQSDQRSTPSFHALRHTAKICMTRVNNL